MTHPHLALYRPDPIVVTSTHGGRGNPMRRLARVLSSKRVPWGYVGTELPERTMVVYAEREWLEAKIDAWDWGSTIEVVRSA